jgi:alkanesulfonate monooxygenase SsuD/methylene tetrahydromethanopterin reductase-like flavin-dependent oxidoreductase (luciferase family)
MKFGLFYELSVPRPWTRESERIVYDNALAQVKLADELGFDQVWAVEHHFLEEYSHCPAPELFLTACAMTTTRIRVGHGIIVCVPEFNHPIKIAERTAVLDILSGGRLEVGTGRSATWTELAGFNANPDLTKKSWDEFVRCLPKMWTSEKFSFEGEFCPRARSYPRSTSGRTRRCGWRSRAPAPSWTQPTAASAASASPSASSPSRRSASRSIGGASSSAAPWASSSTIRSAR